MALELLDPRDRGQLGPVQRPTRHDHKARLEDIAAISGDRPAPRFLIPARLFDLRLETGPLIEIEVLPDPLGVRKDLRREGVLLLRDVAGLFEQRQIDVGFDVTLGAGIAVPVPSPAKIPGLLNDANVGDPGLLQPRRRQEAAKAPADDHHIEFLVQRRAREARLDVGVHVVVRVLAGDFLVLVVSVRAQSLRALRGVLLAQVSGVKAQLCGSRNSVRFGLCYGCTHRVSPPFRLGCFPYEASQVLRLGGVHTAHLV